MVRLLQTHAGLVLATEVGQARFETGAYRFWRLHLRHLAREAEVADPEVIAELLLAPLAPEVFLEQRRLGASLRAIERSLSRVAVVLANPGMNTVQLAVTQVSMMAVEPVAVAYSRSSVSKWHVQ